MSENLTTFNNGVLYLGDCLEKMKNIPDKSVGMLCTDLPYGVLNRSNPSARWDSVIPLDKLWKEMLRITKDDAAMLLFGQGMFSSDLMQSQRDIWRYNLVWNKVNPTDFLNANLRPLSSHEDIMVFYKNQPVYHPQKNSSELDVPSSIVTFKRKHDIKHHYHPTEKPVDLISYLIRTYSNSGDVVADVTAGSCTTCVAAELTGRRFIGIEKDPTYYNIGVSRILEAEKNHSSIRPEVQDHVAREETLLSNQPENLDSDSEQSQSLEAADEVSVAKKQEGNVSLTSSFGSNIKTDIGELYHDNDLEALKRLPDKSVDMIFSDLTNDNLTKNCTLSKAHLDKLWKEWLRVSKDNAPIVLFGSGMSASDVMESQRKLWQYNLICQGQDMVDIPDNMSRPMSSHEYAMVFYKKRPVYHPQMELFVGTRHGKGTKAFNYKDFDGSNTYGVYKQLPTAIRKVRYPKSILPVKKSSELFRYLIRTYSNPGDVVLNPFADKGDICVAAEQEGRKFIGIEENPVRYSIAADKLDKKKSHE